jgi:hypothetical protein
MDKRAIWAERVAEWKASGLTSEKYCEGKFFTANLLRQWAYQLRHEEPHRPKETSVRIARVVRRQAELRNSVPVETAPSEASPAASAALVVECSGMRLVVQSGFDRQTLAAVLDVLAARRGVR